MWGKLRRKISRTKSAVGQDNAKEVVLNNSEVVPSRNENPSDCFYTDRDNSSDENGFQNHDGQADCRCSPLLHFQKHFFGSFRSKRVAEDCGERSADSPESLRKKIPELKDADESTRAEEPKRLSVDTRSHNGMDSGLSQTCDQLVEDSNSCELGEDILEWASTDTVGTRQTGEREILEDIPMPLLEDTKLPPPKLKRRERAKVLETGEPGRTFAKSEQNYCSSVYPDTAAESVALQRDYSMLSTICESRSGFNITNASAEAVCSSSHMEGAQRALDCSNEMVLMYKCDDKEESMDSGHHPSDGDVEKGHSSPDLDLDEFDGRESGYTTLDDFQPLPLEAQQLSLYAASLGVDVDAPYDPSDCISAHCAQFDMLALHSECETCQSGISTLVNEPTAHRYRTSAWLQPVDNLAFTSGDVISSDQSNSNISASFPVEFGSRGGRNIRQWEHVDYVPADVSVSKIYEDSSNSGINDVYASVPRYSAAKLEESSVCERAVSEDKQLSKKNVEMRSSNWSAKDDVFENGSLGSLETGIAASSHAVLYGPTDEWKGTYPDLSSAALDSDDGENVPPVPSRNYETCIGSMNVELESQNLEESNERIHMSWEEVMREARSLGIPLNRPQLDKPYRLPFSEQPVQSDSLMPHASEAGQVDCSLEKSAVCSLNPTAKSKIDTKKGSPFKEKFRLPNPFSRKNKPEHNESFADGDGGRKNKHLHGTPTKGKKSSIFRHHSSVDIQKRCLPRPPPADADSFGIDQLDCGGISRASSQSGNQRMAISLHLQFPSDASTNQSWGSSNNILRVSSTGCRSRRVFSESSQWPNSSESLLPFSDNGDGTGA